MVRFQRPTALRKQDYHEVQAGLGCIVSSRLACLKNKQTNKSNHFNMLQQDIGMFLSVKGMVESM